MLPFRTTQEDEPLVGTIGQPRALAAIEFGLAVETFDCNLLVAGAPRSGRLTTVPEYLERFTLRAQPRRLGLCAQTAPILSDRPSDRTRQSAGARHGRTPPRLAEGGSQPSDTQIGVYPDAVLGRGRIIDRVGHGGPE